MNEKDNKYDSLTLALQDKEEQLHSLNNEKLRVEKEATSKINNLNHALIQSKKMCAELTEQNEMHRRKEWELAQKLEDLQLANIAKVKPVPCKVCIAQVHSPVKKEEKGGAFSCTPGKPLPGHTQAESLLIENKRLKQDLLCLQTNFELTSQKSSQLRSQVKEMEVSISKIQSILDKTLAEKEDLQCSLEKMKSESRNQFGLEMEKKKKEMADMSELVQKLQEEMEQLKTQNTDLQNKLKKELKQRTNHDLVDTKTKSLTNEKLMMQEEVTALQEKLGEMEDRCQELESKSKAHLDEKKKSKGALAALKSKISQLTKEKAELLECLDNISKELDQAYDTIKSHDEEKKMLEIKINAKDKELLNAKRKEQPCLPSVVKKLEAKMAEMADEIEELCSINCTLEATKAKYEQTIAELNKSNSKLSRESRHGSDLARKMNSELEKMEEKIQDLEGDLARKSQKCNTIQQKLDEAKLRFSKAASAKSESEEDAKNMAAKLSELEQRNFKLSSNFESCRAERDHAKLASSNVEQKLSEVEAKLDAVEFAILERDSQISDMKCTTELMEAENSTLLSQVTSLSEMVSTRNLKIESQQIQMARHQSEVLDIMEKISDLETEHGGCAKAISELKKSNCDLKELQESIYAEKEEIEKNLASLKLKVRDLADSNAVLKVSNSDLQDKFSQLSAKNEELLQKISSSESCVDQLEKDLKSEKVSLRAKEDELRHTKKMYEEESARLEDRIDILKSKCSDLEYQCQEYHREKVELKSCVLELQAEVKEQAYISSELKKERDVLTEQYDQLKESALSVLHSDEEDMVSVGEENKTLSKAPKTILKKGKRKALKPIQQLVD